MARIFFVLLFFSSVSIAAPVVVDFDEIAEQFPGFSVESNGFLFESGTGYSFILSADSKGLAFGLGGPYTMTQVHGAVFDFLSLDIGKCPNCWTARVDITGHFAEGGSIETSLQTGEFLETFAFSSEWVGLERVEFFSDSILIDNVALNVVPIPAAAWLFGSALAGLAGFRRYRGAPARL